tara:strand:- start:1636 stop:2505 length:870 start_codon:yes stop_codon:yes gene_type:complete
MLDQAQIEKLFDSLSDDVFEFCDAYGFLNTLQYKRDQEKYPFEISTPQQGLYQLSLRFAHVSFFIAVGRLMDSSDKKDYSLAYALRQLGLYTPSIEHLSVIWKFKTENWSHCGTNKQPTESELEKIRNEFQDQVDRCKSLFDILKADYEPIKKMRDKHYAHTDRSHANRANPLSLKVVDVDKFVDDLKKFFNELSGMFRNGSYAFNLDQGASAAHEMLWLKRNERLDLGLSILAGDEENGISDQLMRDIVVDFYKRSEPFRHEPHNSVLQNLKSKEEERQKRRRAQFKE